MTNQQVIPNYLPSITDWLDHVAGIPTTGVAKAMPELSRSNSTGAQTASVRPCLGSDFTHIIVAR
jgi:hypothetical protein